MPSRLLGWRTAEPVCTSEPVVPVRSSAPARADGMSRRNARYTPLAVDGPLPLDMIRGVPAIMRDPLAWLGQVVERHGDLVAFPMPRTPVLLVNTPAGARHVLQRNHRNYTKATIQYGALSAVTGSGLLTSDGEVWRRHRRAVQPAFHHGGLGEVASITVAAGEHLRTAWDGASAGTTVDAEAAIMRTMLTVVGRTLFADDLSAAGDELVHTVDRAVRLVIARATNPFAAGPLARIPTRSARRMRAAVDTLDRIVDEMVDRRLARGVTPADPDLLGLLLRAAGLADPIDPVPAPALSGAHPGPVMTMREVRDEVVTLVIAGHETVASSLVWTLHLLATNPDAQRRLLAELDEVLHGRPPSWKDVPHLVRTRAVVDEALRLYPPAWIITRRAAGSDTIDGVEIPEGTLVLISPWLLHRDPRSWPDPHRFDPERFLDAGPGEGDRHPAYLPFGAGPRLCIGRDFALAEAVLLLATLLRDRAVQRPVGVSAPKVEALVTLRPRNGLPIALVPRVLGAEPRGTSGQ